MYHGQLLTTHTLGMVMYAWCYEQNLPQDGNGSALQHTPLTQHLNLALGSTVSVQHSARTWTSYDSRRSTALYSCLRVDQGRDNHSCCIHHDAILSALPRTSIYFLSLACSFFTTSMYFFCASSGFTSLTFSQAECLALPCVQHIVSHCPSCGFPENSAGNIP